jgi:hypothetical protein
LRPGSGSQLFSGLSGSNLRFPGGSELNCAALGLRTTTNLTRCPVRVLNYKSQQPPSKPRSYVHVSSFIFFSADKFFWTGPRRIFRSIFGIFLEPVTLQNSEIYSYQLTNPNARTMFHPRMRRSHPLCPEPLERRCLSRGTPRRTSPAFSYSSPPVQMRSASSGTINDSYHGCSWGTCLPYVHPLPSFALRVGNDLQ